MGPRPDGRGKPCCGQRLQKKRPGVNGAAARRPRKGGGRPRMSASKRRRQWGRGQTAAESCARGRTRDGRALRQWGRGQTAAESPAPCAIRDRHPQRQWGRGQTAAERSAKIANMEFGRIASMGPRPDGRGKPQGFQYWVFDFRVNGAAARRPRKGRARSRATRAARGVNGAAARRPRKDWRGRLLRIGRDGVNGAAARRPRKDCKVELRGRGAVASMGPRPDGRGKRWIACARTACRPRQWGRGQTAAERARAPSHAGE